MLDSPVAGESFATERLSFYVSNFARRHCRMHAEWTLLHEMVDTDFAMAMAAATIGPLVRGDCTFRRRPRCHDHHR